MTPQGIIRTARTILNDNDPGGYRQEDDELVGYINAGLQEVSILRPDLFQAVGHIECAPDTVEQALPFSSAQKLVTVIGVHDGPAVTPFDLNAMQAFNRNWKQATAGEARQWSAHPGDPLRFYLYPKAPADTPQLIDVLYIKNPATVGLTDTITDVPATFESALVDYVIYRAESKDDENVLNQRAAASYSAFVAKVKGTSQ